MIRENDREVCQSRRWRQLTPVSGPARPQLRDLRITLSFCKFTGGLQTIMSGFVGAAPGDPLTCQPSSLVLPAFRGVSAHQ
jgi:hypothetical protein